MGTPPDNNKVVAYLRVSTDGQAQDGYGLEAQAADIRRWARAGGHRIVAIHRETVSGAAPLEARTELTAALADLETSKASTLVVARLDRLARDLVIQEVLIKDLASRGIEVVSVAEPDLGGPDHTRKLIRQLLGALAEWERSVIAARLAAGKAVKRSRGGYTGGGIPYGYRAENAELVPDEAEQQIVREVLRLSRAGASTREIASELERRGVAARRGGRWHSAQIARIVRTASGPDRHAGRRR